MQEKDQQLEPKPRPERKKNNTNQQALLRNNELSIFSVNINGLNSLTKRKKTLHNLIKQKYDIISLQETHIKNQHVNLLTCPRLGELFFSLADVKKRGIAVYINPKLSPKLIYSDKNGQILIIQIALNQIPKTNLITIYAPSIRQATFFSKLAQKLQI